MCQACPSAKDYAAQSWCLTTVFFTFRGLSAVAGLLENGRRGAVRGAIVPLLGVPVLLRLQRMEFRRLSLQARRNPRWWNRRLQMQPPDRSTSSDPDQQVLGQSHSTESTWRADHPSVNGGSNSVRGPSFEAVF